MDCKGFRSRITFSCTTQQWPVSLSWAESTEKPLVMVLKGCDKCSGWLWHKVLVEQPVWHCLDLTESGWRPPAGTAGALLTAVRLCHVPDLPVLLGCSFHPQQAAPHPRLPGAPQLCTTPFTVMGHLQELPPGLWCSPGSVWCWWVDGFQITSQITVYSFKANYFNLQS